jgi:hypothetical protein
MQLLDDLALGHHDPQADAIQEINDQYLGKTYRWALSLVVVCLLASAFALLAIWARSRDWLLLVPPLMSLSFLVAAMIVFLQVRRYHQQKESSLSAQWNIWTWRMVFSLALVIVLTGGGILSIAAYISYERKSRPARVPEEIRIDPNLTRDQIPVSPE